MGTGFGVAVSIGSAPPSSSATGWVTIHRPPSVRVVAQLLPSADGHCGYWFGRLPTLQRELIVAVGPDPGCFLRPTGRVGESFLSLASRLAGKWRPS